MRLARIAAPVTIAALAAGGVAVAHGGGGHQPKTEPAAATFTATPDPASRTRTCTGADGTYNETFGVYRGTSTGDPRLTGALLIRSHTLVNTTTGFGTTTGKVSISNSEGRKTAVAGFSAVNTQNGKLDGFLTGQARDTPGKTRLFANFSATFNADGSQLSGELGSEAPVPPQNSAVFQKGHCDNGRRGHDDDQGEHHDNGHHGQGHEDNGRRGH
jgi:hypothetical protein